MLSFLVPAAAGVFEKKETRRNRGLAHTHIMNSIEYLVFAFQSLFRVDEDVKERRSYLGLVLDCLQMAGWDTCRLLDVHVVLMGSSWLCFRVIFACVWFVRSAG